MDVDLLPLGPDNWRACRDLRVHNHQRRFVATPAEYAMLCTYGGLWTPVAVTAGGETVGFAMWGVDPDDGSFWLGGILIDRAYQGQGLGRAAVEALLAEGQRRGHARFALSYHPDNPAGALYRSVGFTETDERIGDEVVARLER